MPVTGPVAVEHQDSLEDSWEGLVDYLNLTVNSAAGSSSTDPAIECMGNSDACQDFLAMGDMGSNNVGGISTSSGTSLPMIEPLTPEPGDINAQQPSDFLLHNVSMPANSMNTTIDLGK